MTGIPGSGGGQSSPVGNRAVGGFREVAVRSLDLTSSPEGAGEFSRIGGGLGSAEIRGVRGSDRGACGVLRRGLGARRSGACGRRAGLEQAHLAAERDFQEAEIHGGEKGEDDPGKCAPRTRTARSPTSGGRSSDPSWRPHGSPPPRPARYCHGACVTRQVRRVPIARRHQRAVRKFSLRPVTRTAVRRVIADVPRNPPQIHSIG